MKLRYYMRGLGIGIFITAIIMRVVLGGPKEKLTDDEVRARAKEIGMVENTVLSSMTSGKAEGEPEGSEADGQEEKRTGTEGTEAAEEAGTEEEVDSVEDTKVDGQTTEESKLDGESEEQKEPKEAGEMITISINPGESSGTVSRSLAEAGLVRDAREYDRYLCDNGYDKKLSIGTYKIPMGSTEEEIAKVITKRLSFE